MRESRRRRREAVRAVSLAGGVGQTEPVHEPRRRHRFERRAEIAAPAQAGRSHQQQAAAPFGDELRRQVELPGPEELGLDVGEDHGVVAEQRRARARIPGRQGAGAPAVALHVEGLLAPVVLPLADHGVEGDARVGQPRALQEAVLVARRAFDDQEAAGTLRRGHQDPAAVVARHDLAGGRRDFHRVQRGPRRVGRDPERDAGRRAAGRRTHPADFDETPAGEQPHVEGYAAEPVADDGGGQVHRGPGSDRPPRLDGRDLPVRPRSGAAHAERVDGDAPPRGGLPGVPPAGRGAVGDDDDPGEGPVAEPRRDRVEGAGEIGPRRGGRERIDLGCGQPRAERQHLDVERRAERGEQTVADERAGGLDPRPAVRVRDGHAARVVDEDGHDAAAGGDGLGAQRPQQHDEDDQESAQPQRGQARPPAAGQPDRRPRIGSPRRPDRHEHGGHDGPPRNRRADLHRTRSYRRPGRGRGGWSASER